MACSTKSPTWKSSNATTVRITAVLVWRPGLPPTTFRVSADVNEIFSNFSSSLSIEKFGLETLLFKKLESDRKFAKQLEDEKSELLHMMYTQKKLFERVNNNKFSFKNFNLFSKAKIYYIYLPIILAYYIAT